MKSHFKKWGDLFISLNIYPLIKHGLCSWRNNYVKNVSLHQALNGIAWHLFIIFCHFYIFLNYDAKNIFILIQLVFFLTYIRIWLNWYSTSIIDYCITIFYTLLLHKSPLCSLRKCSMFALNWVEFHNQNSDNWVIHELFEGEYILCIFRYALKPPM